MRDVRLPEFDKNRCITQQTCLVFDNDSCNYDIILGTNFLTKVGIKLNYEENQMESLRPLLRTFYVNGPVTSSSPNLTLVCNTIPSNFTKKVKIYVQSLRRLASTNT
jgi:hypothetical protein